MLEYLFAYALVFAGHEIGHEVEAGRQNVPLSWHTEKTGLTWTTANATEEKLAMIGGAGFRAQDTVAKYAAGYGIEKEIRLASAFSKISYLLAPQSIHKYEDDVVAGDLAQIEQVTPNARYFVLASGLADIYKAYRPNDNWNINYYQFVGGGSGLVFTMKF